MGAASALLACARAPQYALQAAGACFSARPGQQAYAQAAAPDGFALTNLDRLLLLKRGVALPALAFHFRGHLRP